MPHHRYWWVVIPVLLLTAWLGIVELDRNPFWGDERHFARVIGGVYDAPNSVGEVVEFIYTQEQRHVPAYYVALVVWSNLAGWTPLALRTLSLFAGLLTVAAVYRLGVDLGSRRAGLYAALLLATSALFLHQMPKVRMYVPLVCVVAVAALLYFRLLASQRPRRWLWLAFTAAVAIGPYVHYMAAVPLAALGGYHLLVVPKNRRWWQVFGCMVAGALCFVPWLPALMAGIAVEAQESHVPLSVPGLLVRLAEVFGNGSLVLVVVGGLVVLSVRDRTIGRFLLLSVLATALLAVLHVVSHVIRWARISYFIQLWPFFTLLLALALARLAARGQPGRWISLVLVVAWAGLGLFNHAERIFSFQVDTFRFVFPTHQLERLAGPLIQASDAVFLFLPDHLTPEDAAASRFIANRLEEERPGDYQVTASEFYSGQADEERRVRLETLAGRSRIWLARANGPLPSALPEFETSLSQSYVQCPETLESSDMTLTQYALDPVCCLSATMPEAQIRFENGAALVNSAARFLADESRIQVAALWYLPADAPLHELSYTLQAVTEDGERVSQADAGLPPQAYTCTFDTMDAEVTPGNYSLETGLYFWQTGRRVPGVVTATGAAGEALPLGLVTVPEG